MALNGHVFSVYAFRERVNSAIERPVRVTLPPYFTRREPGLD